MKLFRYFFSNTLLLFVFYQNIIAQPSFVIEPIVTSENAISIDLTYQLDLSATLYYVIYNSEELTEIPLAADVKGANGVFETAKIVGSGNFTYTSGSLITETIDDAGLVDSREFDVFIVAEDASGFSVVKEFKDLETNRPNVTIIQGSTYSPLCRGVNFIAMNDITIQEVDKRNFSVGDVDEVFLFSII